MHTTWCRLYSKILSSFKMFWGRQTKAGGRQNTWTSTVCQCVQVYLCVSWEMIKHSSTKNHSRQHKPLTHRFYDSHNLNVQARLVNGIICEALLFGVLQTFFNIHYDAGKYYSYKLLNLSFSSKLSFYIQVAVMQYSSSWGKSGLKVPSNPMGDLDNEFSYNLESGNLPWPQARISL